MTILIGGLFPLIYMVSVAMEKNAQNLIRNEAVRVAEQYMSQMKTTPFPQLSAGASCSNVNRQMRLVNEGGSGKQYTVCTNIADLSPFSKELTVAVGWDYKGSGGVMAPTNRQYQHSIISIYSSAGN